MLRKIICIAIAFILVAKINAAEYSYEYSDDEEEGIDIDSEEMSMDHLNKFAELVAEEIVNDDDNYDDEDDDAEYDYSYEIVKGRAGVGKTFKKGMKALLKGGLKGIKKGGKLLGKMVYKGGKLVGKGVLQGGKKAGKLAWKGSKKALKGLKNQASKSGKLIWKKLKEKYQGESGQAARKLIGKLIKKAGEEFFTLAVEALTPMLFEYIMVKVEEGVCNCPDNLTCTCCLTPPGLDTGCLELKVRPIKKWIGAIIKYNDTALSRTQITDEGGEKICQALTDSLHFIEVCVEPEGLEAIKNGYRGCWTVSAPNFGLSRTMCLRYEDGVASFSRL